ncbi:FkbM family methyltransferase [Mariniradius sediminis]|uniref:FkbM family methyltransferase n=1 Tax=Mariniradius sediminis TaxID=2909237 RepID=A0ABS9BQH6_9BACT|nr:FkbM family methyltransferase [Mariniradius sediminis]MCF1750310.1 FkbM family methyltransferase [Mariniradius sediminis]
MKPIKKYFHHHLARPFYEIIRPLQPILNLKKRTFFDKFKVRTQKGTGFWLYNNAFALETEIFWKGFDKINWEMKTREIWEELSKSSRTILDIGANTGVFSILAKASYPNASVFAFEPQPNIFEVLKKNNTINGFDIHCIPLALSDQEGELPFYNTGFSTFEGNNTTHGSLNKEWRTEKQASIIVNVDRLDNFLIKQQVGKVDLVKIDVETLEYEVLKGYGSLLDKHRPILILEIQNQDIGKKVASLFDIHSYFFFWVNEDKGLHSVQSLGENTSQEHLNYLICPEEKQQLVQKFLADV